MTIVSRRRAAIAAMERNMGRFLAGESGGFAARRSRNPNHGQRQLPVPGAACERGDRW